MTSLPVGLKGRTRVRQCHFRFVTSLPVGKHAVHLHDIRVMTSLPVVRYFVTSLPVGFRGYTSPRVHIPEGTHPRGYTSPCPTTAEHTTYDMVGRGLISKMRREMEKDCKDWYQRQQKGGRVRKRKPKKQTGAGKKRKPRKQKGSGKKTGKKRKSRKQTGDGLWSGIKEIFE